MKGNIHENHLCKKHVHASLDRQTPLDTVQAYPAQLVDTYNPNGMHTHKK